jgi:branched-chain amino acid transport system ATP-binding protein
MTGTEAPLLALRDVNTYYGQIHILKDINIAIGRGELVCLLGGNASGKSTTLKTILGIVSPSSGTVHFDGVDVTAETTSSRIARGMAIVPENRRLFAPMTVVENLEMGAYLRADDPTEDLERVYELFPVLATRTNQLAGTLSGGEQQMVAMGRALMSKPQLLLMDEPSMGLAPILVEQSFEIIERVHQAGVDPGRRAERQLGALHRRSWLRALHRADRARRRRRSPLRARGSEEGVSWALTLRTEQ